MVKKIYFSFLVSLGLFTSSLTSTNFKIVSHSNSAEDIKIMYEYKNEIIQNYQQMILGIDEKQVVEDLMIMFPGMVYENESLLYVIGKGEGSSLEGELKSNYCDVEVKPKSFLAELFN